MLRCSRASGSGVCSLHHQLIFEWLTRRPFYRLHVVYFLVLAMVGSFAIWLSPKPPTPSSSPSSSSSSQGISYIDALYNAASAVTMTGLSSVEMHRFSLFDQVVLMLLTVLGGQVFTSMIPLFIRHRIMMKAFRDPDHIHDQCNTDHGGSGLSRVMSSASSAMRELLPVKVPELILTSRKLSSHEEGIRRVVSMPALQLTAANYMCKRSRRSCRDDHAIDMAAAEAPKSSLHDELLQQQAGGNGSPPSCKQEATRAEAEALSTLLWVVGGYLVGVQLAGYVICQVFFLASSRGSRILAQSHVSPSFFSAFAVVSAFGNSGYLPLDQNLVPFQRGASPVLLCLGALILLGNTLYPPALRLLIFSLHKISKGPHKQAYAYLLDNPRRCYTHLFPRFETLWLALTVLLLNCSQMACIYSLDWNSPAVQGLGAGDKLVDGMLQSLSSRTGGMAVVNLAALSAPTLLLFVGMMYIAIYPIYVTRQRSKERTKKSVDSKDCLDSDILVQCSKLLARDSMLFLILFFICLCEKHAIQRDPLNFSIFNIVFEVISGYGNVGVSIGYTCNLRPLASKWTTLGKFTMVVVMMLGRHRGLPDDTDWAIAAPNI